MIRGPPTRGGCRPPNVPSASTISLVAALEDRPLGCIGSEDYPAPAEHGEEILQGQADEVPHEEIAAEIGVSTTVVHNRLFRMRATFRARLARHGMLILLLILFALLSHPVSEVASPAPVHSGSENRPLPSEEIAPLPLK